jgi:hypothetical protein
VELTDTQLRLLTAASQRDDRALERPSNLPGAAAGKVVAKLLAKGLVEEIPSRGSLPVWRREGDIAHTLRITKRGLQAIRVDDEATRQLSAFEKSSRDSRHVVWIDSDPERKWPPIRSPRRRWPAVSAGFPGQAPWRF